MTARAQRVVMLATAAAAMAWAIARAAAQSITIDEAVSYLVFVRHWEFLFFPAANNHLLNTLLEHLATLMFGIHPLSVRGPALIGAALYISAAYRVARRIGGSITVAWPLFVCLVYNPFVFDYLVAARGYGLALGFLMWAIAKQVPGDCEPRLNQEVRDAVVSSTCLGLSLAANLSFALVDLVTLVAVFFLAVARARSYGRALTAVLVPFSTVTAILPAAIILRMPKHELWYGSTSVRDVFASIVAASLFRLNTKFMSPILLKPIEAAKDYLPWLLGLSVLGYAAYQIWRGQPNWKRHFAAIVAVVLAVTLSLHWLCFRLMHLLLPRDRTGLYIVPLVLLVAGAFAAIPASTQTGRMLRAALVGTLFLISAYFLFCLRLNFFKEWEFDADVRDLYSVLKCLNYDRDVRDVATFWMYATPLNYYRVQSGHDTLAEFQGEVPYRPEQQVLVLNSFLEPEVLSGRGLKVLYRGKSTAAVIAATPEAEPSLRSSMCLERPGS